MKNNIVPISLAVILWGCQSPEATSVHDHDHDFIEVNEAQRTMAGIETGRAEKRMMKEYVKCTGQVDVPPESLADISAPLGGFVRKAPFYEGAKVQKGQVLVSLVHPEYIRLQQDYLEAESQLRFLSSDQRRQERLHEGEAASEKRVQEISSAYDAMKARRDGLAAQLRVAGIAPEQLEKNGIQEMVTLRAPFTGIISMVGVNLGKQVGPEEVLYQMYDPTHMHLELQVFPRDIEKIALGNALRYKIQGGTKWKSGHIVLLGGSVDRDLRTIRVHAHPDSTDLHLRPGTYLQVEIESTSEEVWTLPETAFQTEGEQHFIFTAHEGGFRRKAVRVGRKSDGYIELLAPIEEEVVVRGAYYLVDVEGGDHEH